MASFGDLPTEIAQKCVEFLEFDEAIEVKRVSRGLTTFVAKAYMWSQRWKDKEKANAFWMETFEKYGYGWC